MTHLRSARDFDSIDYAAVMSLHEALRRKGFFDVIAYRLGREGKPDYRHRGVIDPEADFKEKTRILG